MNVVPGPQTVNEDGLLTFPAGAISISDPEATSAQVTLSVLNGLLTLGSTAGITFSPGSGQGQSNMTFTRPDHRHQRGARRPDLSAEL